MKKVLRLAVPAAVVAVIAVLAYAGYRLWGVEKEQYVF